LVITLGEARKGTPLKSRKSARSITFPPIVSQGKRGMPVWAKQSQKRGGESKIVEKVRGHLKKGVVGKRDFSTRTKY